MVAKKKKNRKFSKDKFFSILFFMFTFLIFAFLLISNIRIAQKRLSLINEIESLKEKLNFLKDQKIILEASISDTETVDYWEVVLRDQGYIKEGEESVIILSPNERDVSKEEEQSFMQVFLEKIKKLFVWE